ncbi:MAG: PEGA domain-containing protein [Ignavibacteria bacterium]|nr:PEGA domain-containing protein [Ignavibacteria bacterium]
MPAGAKIIVNGNEVGTTPKKVSLTRGEDYYVEFELEGYQKKKIQLTYSVGAGWVILDFLAGLIGLLVDAITGYWNGFDFEFYKVTLEQAQKQ